MSPVLDRADQRKHALDLTKRGWSVFPCDPRTKWPLTRHGFHDASSDPAVVARWNWDGVAIGVATGEASGIDVLDIDPTGLGWLAQNNDRIPTTLSYETPRGGRHLIFKHWPSLRCSASRIAEGVDVRSTGGFAIHWPALGLPVLGDIPIGAWPEWLIGLALVKGLPQIFSSAHDHGPLMASTRELPKPLYLKVLRLARLSDRLTRHHQRRVIGILKIVLQRQDHRNDGLNIAAFCLRELIHDGIISPETAHELLLDVATFNGYIAKDGMVAADATIRSGLAPLEGHKRVER
jgi:hypothetical protein